MKLELLDYRTIGGLQMSSLVVISGPSEGDYYPLGQRTVVIGRDEACPIQIVDDLVSRKHMQIRHDVDAGGFVATDMKSANGMMVNGREIAGEIALEDGDLIEIGKSRINFYATEFADRESAWAHYKERGQKFKNTLEQ